MRILVTGSRDWADWNLLNNTLNEYAECENIVIVHGDCPTGADVMAQKWADCQGVRVERYPADWKRYKKSAGPIRNQQMVDLGADVCLAFPLPQSRGTIHCMEAARKAGIPVRVIKS
jgi:hypothetical protein